MLKKIMSEKCRPMDAFSELDNRLSSLELQVKELQEWRKQVQDRLQI